MSCDASHDGIAVLVRLCGNLYGGHGNHWEKYGVVLYVRFMDMVANAATVDK
jgi:hypothetical protein